MPFLSNVDVPLYGTGTVPSRHNSSFLVPSLKTETSHHTITANRAQQAAVR